METVDVRKEMLEEVDLLGKTGYFTELRVDKDTVPEGMHCYELRHGDDDGFPVSVEENVRVNYFGAVLLAEALELGEDKALQFGYEDFGYTGEQMYLSQIQGKKPEEQRDADEYEPLQTGAELIKFMHENGISFQINEQEADLLCEYMDGHGYVIGHKDGQLCRGDLCAEPDRTVWEETIVDDLIDSAMEWNYDLLQQVRINMEKPDNFIDFVNQHSRYEDLCAEEKIFDALFDRTKYGERIERIAETLATQLIQNLQSKGDIDGAVKELAQGIKGGLEATALQKPEQKKERAR
uniref:LPD28 domain-containing protein n=1 Tax=Enterocloster clostridioformis TaxID=1531 RepID=UPI0025A599CE|nr:LPD28 domain-containing protein [Enterocloster clostridioformis]